MNKIIRLLDITSSKHKDEFVVIYKLMVDDEPFDLRYTVSIMGADVDQTVIDTVPWLCDPVVVSLMYNMLTAGYDFQSDIPISPKLYHHLTKDFIPHFVSMNPDIVKPVKIEAPLAHDELERCANWVGTGVSCGIDSFSAIKEYLQEAEPDYRLTHLLYFKIGAHHGRKYPCPEELENKIFNEELAIANDFCEREGFKLVVVDSNVNQMANKFWGPMPFGNVAWFRNVGVMLVLQKYFAKYVMATSYATFTDFSMDFSDGLEHNLWWSLPLLGSDNLEVIPAGSSMTRIEKTAYLCDFKPAHDNLMVCWAGHINCGECDKCIRTLVALDFLGQLDKFQKSFDLDRYRKNRKRHLQHVVTYASRDAFFRELCEYAKQNNIKMPGKTASVIAEYWRMARHSSLSALPHLVIKRLKAVLNIK